MSNFYKIQQCDTYINDVDGFFNNVNDIIELNKHYEAEFKKLFKSLDVVKIRSLSPEYIKLFLQKLHSFLNSCRLTRSEKILFLNGTELCLIQLSLKYNLPDIAKHLSSYCHTRDLQNHNAFISELIIENDYNTIFNLLNITDNWSYGGSQLLRLLFLNGCRDIQIYKTLVFKYNLNINEVGIINNASKGSLTHIVLASLECEFVKNYIEHFNHTIRTDNYFTLKSGSKIRTINMVLNNSSKQNEDKINVINYLLLSELLNEEDVNILLEHLCSDKNFVNSYSSGIFQNIFTTKVFNSSIYLKSKIVKNLILLDSSAIIANLRLNKSLSSDPVIVVLSKLKANSSQLIELDNQKVINDWIVLSDYKFRTVIFLEKLLDYLGSIEGITLEFDKGHNPEIINLFKSRGVVFASKAGLLKNIIKNKGLKLNASNVLDSEQDCTNYPQKKNLLQDIEPSIMKIVEHINNNIENYKLISIDKFNHNDKYVLEELPIKISTLLSEYQEEKNYSNTSKHIELMKILIAKLTTLESNSFQILEEKLLNS